MSFIRVGRPIRLFGTLMVGNVPTNATTLRLVVVNPTGDDTEYLYGQDPEIVRPSTGQYYFDLLVNAPGVWTYSWFAEGSNTAFKTGTVDVARPLTITSVSDTATAVPFVSIRMWDGDGNDVDIEGTRTDSTGQHVSSVTPGTYRIVASKGGWIFESAKMVDLAGAGPYTIQVEGRLLSSRWLTWEDLEMVADRASIDRIFNDQNTSQRDMVTVEAVIQQAEALAESKLLRNWTREQITLLARSDAAVRGQAAWLALELGTERKHEFISTDGKGRYWSQYERAIDFFESLARSESRPRGEEASGPGANVGGEVRPVVPPYQDSFTFAPGRGGRGPGGF
jgi:hypothetical protein